MIEFNKPDVCQKPNTKTVVKEFDIPFEIVQIPDFDQQSIKIDNNYDLIQKFMDDRKIKILPKNSFIEVDLTEHFGYT